MSTNARASTTNGHAPTTSSSMPEKSYFESQRELLVGEIAQSLEHVLQNINKLNRSLEEIIAVGNEFSPVEALWSQFENVMAKDPEEQGQEGGEGGTRSEGEGEQGDEDTNLEDEEGK